MLGRPYVGGWTVCLSWQLYLLQYRSNALPSAGPKKPPLFRFDKTKHSLVSGGFHALSKIRQSLREKKPPLGKRAGTVEDVSHELDAVKVDLQVQFDLVRFPDPPVLTFKAVGETTVRLF